MSEDKKMWIGISIMVVLMAAVFAVVVWLAERPACAERQWSDTERDWKCMRMDDAPRQSQDCTRQFRTRNGQWECVPR